MPFASKFCDAAQTAKPHEQVINVQGKTRSAAAPAATIMHYALNQYTLDCCCARHMALHSAGVDSHSRVICAEKQHGQQPPSLRPASKSQCCAVPWLRTMRRPAATGEGAGLEE